MQIAVLVVTKYFVPNFSKVYFAARASCTLTKLFLVIVNISELIRNAHAQTMVLPFTKQSKVVISTIECNIVY